MKFSYPHVIENSVGEKIIFKELVKEPDGDRLMVENFVTPGNGPIMHTHWLQDEALTVIKGRIGYQVLGHQEKYAGVGETVEFKRGVPHRFWNAGDDVLNCVGWIKPANNIEFFLTSLYDSQKKTGKAQLDKYDGAFLLTRYSSEFDIPEIPGFVKKVILPVTYVFGRLLGKYKKYKDAPPPVKL